MGCSTPTPPLDTREACDGMTGPTLIRLHTPTSKWRALRNGLPLTAPDDDTNGFPLSFSLYGPETHQYLHGKSNWEVTGEINFNPLFGRGDFLSFLLILSLYYLLEFICFSCICSPFGVFMLVFFFLLFALHGFPLIRNIYGPFILLSCRSLFKLFSSTFIFFHGLYLFYLFYRNGT